MAEFVFSLGYLGLFLVSLLGATIIPLSTEIFVVGMPLLGYNTWIVILVATLGGYVGNLINYTVGRKGTEFIFSRYVTIKPEHWEPAAAWFQHWGAAVLFFSWLPVIGDPLTIVAGAFHTDLRIFTFWVILGKIIRYLILLGITNALFSQV